MNLENSQNKMSLSENNLNENSKYKFDKNNKFIIKYKNSYYDLTKFIKKHPGGYNTLCEYNNKDIGRRMNYSPAHSDAAMYLMREYKMKKSHMNGVTLLGDEKSDIDCNGNGYIKENEFECDEQNNLHHGNDIMEADDDFGSDKFDERMEVCNYIANLHAD